MQGALLQVAIPHARLHMMRSCRAWQQVLIGLANRGGHDLLIACVEGLKRILSQQLGGSASISNTLRIFVGSSTLPIPFKAVHRKLTKTKVLFRIRIAKFLYLGISERQQVMDNANSKLVADTFPAGDIFREATG